MTDIYGYSITKHYDGVPCSCCGATYSTKQPLGNINSKKGIHIIDGICGSNARRKSTELTHLNTRNGQFTIVIKYK